MRRFGDKRFAFLFCPGKPADHSFYSACISPYKVRLVLLLNSAFIACTFIIRPLCAAMPSLIPLDSLLGAAYVGVIVSTV